MNLDALLTVHLVACAFMTGLIWLIQLVHYPSFHFVEKQSFVAFEAFHSQRITWIVLPIMSLELVTAALLVWVSLNTPNFLGLGLNFGSVGALWIYTLFVSAPLHGQLLKSAYDRNLVDRLVATNWGRTALWTARTTTLIYYFLAI